MQAQALGDQALGDRIRSLYSGLTPGERRLAEAMLEIGSDLPSRTAAEIAAQAGTSQATAARFFRRLGYESWADLRQQARRAGGASPFEALVESGGRGADLGRHLAQEVENLTRSFGAIPPAAFEEASRLLSGARRILVLGFRTSQTLALHARALLLHLHPRVQVLPQTGMTLAEEGATLGDGDVLLAIGFRRRPARLEAFLELAVERGVPVVLLSDPAAAVAMRLATVSLPAQIRGTGPFDSYVAGLSVLSHLAARVAEAGGEAVRDRLAAIEALHERLDSFG
ncbi:MurR/RpiR family transcriptional regulator [Roseomonas gilardii]|uniref:MurR/RpiR family transcriptional regulator n=1 Tax=Roseomonas gilardii TaxID=257708 RepID=UPI0011A873FA|nr:MurR/RpiR family transcriptional regulator [Roseomonas gilardii]